jgi:hypothetical protein
MLGHHIRDSEEAPCHDQHFVHQHLLLRPLKRMPQLQRDNQFIYNVSWVAGKLSFDGKFVTSVPQSPGYGRKEDPHRSLRFRIKGVQNRKPLDSRLRVPVHTELVSHPTPHKTRQRALKENMIHCFNLPTKSTEPPRLDLFIGGETTSSKLPGKDLYLQREVIVPNKLC